MLFTQFNMEDALEVRYEEGLEDGIEKGRLLTLIQQVYRKQQKGKSPTVIAEEVEEEFVLVERICKAIEICGVDDMDKVYKKVQEFV